MIKSLTNFHICGQLGGDGMEYDWRHFYWYTGQLWALSQVLHNVPWDSIIYNWPLISPDPLRSGWCLTRPRVSPGSSPWTRAPSWGGRGRRPSPAWRTWRSSSAGPPGPPNTRTRWSTIPMWTVRHSGSHSGNVCKIEDKYMTLGWNLAIARYQPRPCGHQGGFAPTFFFELILIFISAIYPSYQWFLKWSVTNERRTNERTYGPDAHTYCLFYSIRWAFALTTKFITYTLYRWIFANLSVTILQTSIPI